MATRRKPHAANRGYHNRVAPKYDAIYDSARWQLYFDLSFEGMKAHLPTDAAAPIIDLGCGTGKYGLRLAKSGYPVTLSDLSPKMLDQSRKRASELGLIEKVTFSIDDICDLSAHPSDHFGLAIAQGDPLSFADNPKKALQEIRRILRPGGVLIASVDQTYAALDHYLESANLDGITELIKTGEMTWLAHRQEERFTVRTFSAESLTKLFERVGFEVLDLFGKTLLPLGKLGDLLEDPKTAKRIEAIERKMCRKPSVLGRCSHLQIAARIS